MSAITILVAATGLILGLRFSAFVLGLLLLLGVASTLTIGIWSGGNLAVVALHMLAMLASVQISYLIGYLIAAQITARATPTSSRMIDPCDILLARGGTSAHFHIRAQPNFGR